MAKIALDSGAKKLTNYEPKHGSGNPGKITKFKGDTPGEESWAPGWGGFDGVQTEGSAEEAEELLDYDTDSVERGLMGDGMNVRNPGVRARYTKHFNDA